MSCAVNVAYGKAANISSRYSDSEGQSGPACVAVNGRTSTSYRTVLQDEANCVYSADGDTNPWWQVDLGQNYSVSNITIYGRRGKAAFRPSGHLVLLT